MDEPTECRYYMVLGRDLLDTLVLDMFYDYIIIGIAQPYKGFLATMVDINNYNFKYLTDKFVKPEELFINFYVNKCF